MSYYQFNRQEILKKAKDSYCKEKAGKFYWKNKEATKEKSKNWNKTLSKEKKTSLKSIKERDTRN